MTDETKMKQVELALDGLIIPCPYTQNPHNEPSGVVVEYIGDTRKAYLHPCKKHLDFYLTFQNNRGKRFWRVLG